MAYALDNPLRRVGPQNSNSPTFWSYADGDALTAIDAADYFLLDVDKLQVGDFIFAVGNSVAGIAVVASRSATAVDVSNFTTIGAIDSD